MSNNSTSVKTSKYEAVSRIVYFTGATSPSDIMAACKKNNISISRKTIYNIMQKITAQDNDWINSTAKTGYIHTVKELVKSKKERLEFLEGKMRASQSDHAVSRLAHEITDTEDSLRVLLENIPLLMMFKQKMNENATIRE